MKEPMTETNAFAMPDVGEGLTEAEIVTWRVKPGDTVAINDLLVEVETAKSLVELPSPYAGTVSQLHASEGETVEVGTIIVSFGDAASPTAPPSPTTERVPTGDDSKLSPEAAADVSRANEDDADHPPEEKRQPVLVGYGPSKAKVQRRARKPGYRVPDPQIERDLESKRPHATPPVRLRAKELGVDLTKVTPTGSFGNITRADLESSAVRRSVSDSVSSEIRTPIKGVRKATAAAMVSSAFSAPHVTEWVTVDVTETLKLLDQLRSDRAYTGVRLTPLALIARAALSALRTYPAMNAKWDDDAGEIVQYSDVNLGIATATPRGLLVPNIKSANAKSLREICDDLAALIEEARSGRTQPATMEGGTFTITNIGVFGVDGGTPILNPGEAGILCVGQIAERPWAHEGAVQLRSLCTLSLSFDHRLVDGQLGSEVLGHISRLLTNPSLALAY
jgi:pyruvate dehydrogenase E2 component (dihydrolipoamide acetyltransferase)